MNFWTPFIRSCNQGSRQRRTGEVTISGQKLQLTRGRVVARVQLNKWAINTHTALPSFLHTLKFGRVAKLDDVSLPRRNSSQLHALVPRERGRVFTFTMENFRRPANCRKSPSPMSSEGKLKLGGGGGRGCSADETSAQWSTRRMQILGRHNRKRATKACRSNSGDITERALSKYLFRTGTGGKESRLLHSFQSEMAPSRV